MAPIKVVTIGPKAHKQLQKLPLYIVDKLLAWVILVETKGIYEVRKIPGFHDEPLHGSHAGERSIRLNRAYRAIYRVLEVNSLEFISVEEIHKHAY